MEMRRSAEVFPPGEFLKEELDERGWTPKALAETLGQPVGAISEIIAGRRGISPETARGLAAALGTTSEFWLNLDSAYRLSLVQDVESDDIARRAELYALASADGVAKHG